MSAEYNCPPVCPQCHRCHRGPCQPDSHVRMIGDMTVEQFQSRPLKRPAWSFGTERERKAWIQKHLKVNDQMQTTPESTTHSAVATIRRHKYPHEYSGWSVEHDSPRWTSDRLDAAPVPLEILISELNKIAARETNIWAVVYPQNAGGMARELAALDSESPNDING